MGENVNETSLPMIIEAALLAAGRPLSSKDLLALFSETERPESAELDAAVETLRAQCAGRPLELVKVASGYRLQVRAEYSPWVSRLWEERAPRYSRALMETLAVIAYRQPVTRGDIEDVRGVAVSSNIVRTLLDRRWVKVVGNRDVPGRPALYGTTREFLDYFGLTKLSELPPLDELRDLDEINVEFDFGPAAAAADVASASDSDERAAGGDGGSREAGAEASTGVEGPERSALATVTPLRPLQADTAAPHPGRDPTAAETAAGGEGRHTAGTAADADVEDVEDVEDVGDREDVEDVEDVVATTAQTLTTRNGDDEAGAAGAPAQRGEGGEAGITGSGEDAAAGADDATADAADGAETTDTDGPTESESPRAQDADRHHR